MDKLILEPNYDDNVSTVYTKMAECFLEGQSPFILSWVGRNDQFLGEISSRVPGWTVENIELPSIIFKAAEISQGKCRIRNENG